MSTALSPIVAGPPVDRHEHVRRITAAWQKTVANIVETGRLLIEAKDDIGHGLAHPSGQGALGVPSQDEALVDECRHERDGEQDDGDRIAVAEL